MGKTIKDRFKNIFAIMALMMCAALLCACGDGTEEQSQMGPGATLSLDLDLPDSTTGGRRTATTMQTTHRAAQSGTGMPCAYMGSSDDDPFKNGYEMTKFMVSAIATWTCYTDTIIEVAAYVPHDGVIQEADNDTSQPDYDSDEPTHYQVSDDSETQTTIRFYYGYDRAAPPQTGDDAQFFLSWDVAENGDFQGRVVLEGEAIDAEDRDPEDPILARMDFNYSDSEKVVDMFMRFDENNPWAEGFRIKITKDLTAGPLGQVFTALGLIEAKAQFLTVDNIPEMPYVYMFTVSDSFGNGAALAGYQQLALPLELNSDLGNHLGNYLFDKDDTYYFDDDMDWDWVNKTITDARYRGGRTTPAIGGTWVPFDPSLGMIANELGLGSDYFTGSQCVNVDDNCTDLLNAVFEDGFADQEPNQGANPGDWRSDAIAEAAYLDTVYPNGVDWSGAFDHVFTPAVP